MPDGRSVIPLAIPVKVFNLHTCKAATADYRLPIPYDFTHHGDAVHVKDCIVQPHSMTDVILLQAG